MVVKAISDAFLEATLNIWLDVLLKFFMFKVILLWKKSPAYDVQI